MKGVQNSLHPFKEWASLFSGKIFVQIVVYCDESDTHGRSRNRRDPVPTWYGWIAERDYWENKFYPQWQKVLNDPKYKAPYFHFSELNKHERHKSGTTYNGWSDSKVDDFLDDLCIVAGRVAVPCGSHGTHEGDRDPYKKIIKLLFKDCFDRINTHWPKLTERVDFFFESAGSQKGAQKWANLILEAANNFREKEPRMGVPSFPRWDDPRHGFPLQAADLLAVSQRQNAAFFLESHKKAKRLRIIDFALLKNVYPKNHPENYFFNFSDEKWEKLIRWFRKDKNERDCSSLVLGERPKEYNVLAVLNDYRANGLKINLSNF